MTAAVRRPVALPYCNVFSGREDTASIIGARNLFRFRAASALAEFGAKLNKFRAPSGRDWGAGGDAAQGANCIARIDRGVGSRAGDWNRLEQTDANFHSRAMNRRDM